MSEMIVAPKGVPKPIIDKLEAAFAQATMTPQYQEMLPPMGISISKKPLVGDPLYQSVKETFDLPAHSSKRWGSSNNSLSVLRADGEGRGGVGGRGEAVAG